MTAVPVRTPPSPARNVLDSDVRQNPYPFYAALRRDAPVCYSDPPGMWLISSYENVVDVARRHGEFSSVAMKRQQGSGDRGVQSVITTDPPVHTRLRGILQREFSSRHLAPLRPRIEALADELISRMLARGRFDFVDDFAIPFPVTVIAEMLGVAPERREAFKWWSDCMVRVVSETSGPAWERAREGVFELVEFFRETIEARRNGPTAAGDLLDRLIAAGREGRLNDKEILSYCTLLLAAGNETTTNLIAGTVVALLDHPVELERLLADPSLVPAAIEEGLRYCSPVQVVFRRAVGDVELRGERIAAGQDVALCLASANRDGAKFADPDRFDLSRNTAGHVGFGYGIHHCLGAHLGRLEAEIALERLLPHLARLRGQIDEIRWSELWFIRGPEHLPLELAA